MGEQLFIGLLLCALGLVFVRFGWGQPAPAYGQPMSSQMGIGLLLMLVLFMLGVWLFIVGLGFT